MRAPSRAVGLESGGRGRRLLVVAGAGIGLALGLAGCAGPAPTDPGQVGAMVLKDVELKAHALGFSVEVEGAWAWGGGNYGVLVRTSDPESKTGYDAYWLTPVPGYGLTLRGSVPVAVADAVKSPHRATCLALVEEETSEDYCAGLRD